MKKDKLNKSTIKLDKKEFDIKKYLILGIIIVVLIGVLVTLGVIKFSGTKKESDKTEDEKVENVTDEKSESTQKPTEQSKPTKDAESTVTQKATDTPVPTEASKDTLTPVPTDTPTPAPTDTPTPKAVSESYSDIIARLKNTTFLEVERDNALMYVLNSVTDSRILEDGSISMDNINREKLGKLQYRLMYCDIFKGNYIEWDDSVDFRKTDKAGLEKFFAGVLGSSDLNQDNSKIIVSGDKAYIEYGAGDPVKMADIGLEYQDDDYYLLSAPVFNDSNGKMRNVFVGRANVLFRKNNDSPVGATLLYAEYEDGKIKVTDSDASSVLDDIDGNSYGSSKLYDGSYSTAWVEGVDGTGAGESVTLYFDKKVLVQGIDICNGYTKSSDIYQKNGAVTCFKIDFGGMFSKEIDCVKGDFSWAGDDLHEYCMEKCNAPEAVYIDYIKITIEKAVSGNKYDDTCVSEVIVY